MRGAMVSVALLLVLLGASTIVDAATCTLHGDPHINTFDGAVFHYQRAGWYVIFSSKWVEIWGNFYMCSPLDEADVGGGTGVACLDGFQVHVNGVGMLYASINERGDGKRVLRRGDHVFHGKVEVNGVGRNGLLVPALKSKEKKDGKKTKTVWYYEDAENNGQNNWVSFGDGLKAQYKVTADDNYKLTIEASGVKIVYTARVIVIDPGNKYYKGTCGVCGTWDGKGGNEFYKGNFKMLDDGNTNSFVNSWSIPGSPKFRCEDPPPPATPKPTKPPTKPPPATVPPTQPPTKTPTVPPTVPPTIPVQTVGAATTGVPQTTGNTQQTSTGTPNTGSGSGSTTGTQQTNTGTQQTSTGTQQTSTGTQQTSTGTQQTSTGTQQTSTGTQQTSTGTPSSGSGSSTGNNQQTSTGSQQTSTGSQQTSTGSQQTSTGSQQTSTGTPSSGSGSSTGESSGDVSSTGVAVSTTGSSVSTTGGSTTGGGDSSDSEDIYFAQDGEYFEPPANQTTDIVYYFNQTEFDELFDSLNGTTIYNDAIESCTNVGLEPGTDKFKLCLFDVIHTEDTGSAVNAIEADYLTCAMTGSDEECANGTVLACPGACSGNGKCIGNSCQCSKGWEGDDCGDRIPLLTDAETAGVITAGVVAGIAIGAAVFVAASGYGAKKGYDYLMHKDNKMTDLHSNPLYAEQKNGGTNPFYDA